MFESFIVILSLIGVFVAIGKYRYESGISRFSHTQREFL